LTSKTLNLKSKQGFTLIELLIVIAIIAILVAATFVALDPLTRFRDSRDAVRATDIEAIIEAIKLYQVDNNGSHITPISSLTDNNVYMIVDGAMSSGCDDNNANCDTNVTNDSACVNIDQLVDKAYLGDVPVSPKGSVTWDDGDVNNDEGTGYTLSVTSTIVTVRACESENTTEIYVTR
jgi:prepilin-type N-terminal cleavage/methylation domain-containing protein